MPQYLVRLTLLLRKSLSRDFTMSDHEIQEEYIGIVQQAKAAGDYVSLPLAVLVKNRNSIQDSALTITPYEDSYVSSSQNC